MQNTSPLRLPLLVLAVLLLAIVTGTAAIFGFTDRQQLATPDWIWCGTRAADGSTCSVSLRFNLRRPVGAVVLRVAASGAARVQLDGTPLGATNATGAPAEIALRDVPAGAHELRIDASHGSGSAGICAFVDLPGGAGDRARLATDATWEERTSGNGSMAAVVAPYSAGPLPSPFGELAASTAVAKDGRFWAVLLSLVVAMAVATLAGPILRPPGQGGRDTAVMDLAIVVPSVIYGSLAFVITSLAATDVGAGLIVALHVASTAVFVLLLIAWKTGERHIEQDQVAHRAELGGYDSMCDAIEMLKLDLGESPAGLRSALQSAVNELAESVRFASTGTAVPELDRSILHSIESLRAAVREGGEGADARIAPMIRAIRARVREREIRLQSSHRA
jgi:hypothetical protein